MSHAHSPERGPETQHQSARLTPWGRRRMVALVEEEGLSYPQAAAACGIAISTVRWWTRRCRDTSDSEREDLSCLGDRTSRPHCSPRGPIAVKPSNPPQTVWRVRKRIGLLANERPDREIDDPPRVALPGRSASQRRTPLRALSPPLTPVTGDLAPRSGLRRRTGRDGSSATGSSLSTRAWYAWGFIPMRGPSP